MPPRPVPAEGGIVRNGPAAGGYISGAKMRRTER